MSQTCVELGVMGVFAFKHKANHHTPSLEKQHTQ